MVAAHLCARHFPFDSVFSRETLREYFSSVLEQASSEQLRDLAAQGLAQLYQRALVLGMVGPGSSTDVPEITALNRALGNPQACHAALLAFTSIEPEEEGPFFPSVTLVEPSALAGVFARADLSLRDTLLALHLVNPRASVFPVDPGTPISAIATQLLRSPETPEGEIPLLLKILGYNHPAILTTLADPELPAERYRQILAGLSEQARLISWSAWQQLVLTPHEHPQLSADLLWMLSKAPRGLQWEYLGKLLRDPHLPEIVRLRLCRNIWHRAHALDHGMVFARSAIETLLDLSAEGHGVARAFGDDPIPKFTGTVTGTSVRRILAMLNDPEANLTTPDRWLLARVLPPDTELSTLDRQSVLRLLLEAYGARPQDRPTLGDAIAAHARRVPAFAQGLLWDDQMAIETRLLLLGRASARDVLRFLADVPLEAAHFETAFACLAPHLPESLGQELLVAARVGSADWREFLTDPAFRDGNGGDLIARMGDARRSELVRVIATVWLAHAADPEGQIARLMSLVDDPETPVAAIAAALPMLDTVNPSNRARYRAALRRRFSFPGLAAEDVARTALLLAPDDSPSVISILSDTRTLPVYREELVCAIESCPQLLLSWSEWQPLISTIDAGKLAARIIRLFGSPASPARRLSASEIFALRERSGLPREVRAELFRLLWSMEDTDPCLLSTRFSMLLDLARDPEVPSLAFPDRSLPQTTERILPEQHSATIALVCDERVPMHTRQLFATCLRDEKCSGDENLLVIDLLKEALRSTPAGDRDYLWGCIQRHAWSVPEIAKRLANDPEIPLTVRLKVAQGLSLPDLLRCAATLPLEARSDALANLSGFFLPPEVRVGLMEAARFDTPSWREVLATSAFFTERIPDLVRISLDRDRPRLIRHLATWLVQRNPFSMPQRFELLRALREGLAEIEPDAEGLASIQCFINDVTRFHRDHKATLGRAIAELIADTAIPGSRRAALFRSLHWYALGNHVDPIWTAIRASDDLDFARAFIAHLTESKILSSDVTAYVSKDANTENGQDAWRALDQIGTVLTADIFQLIAIARRSETPVCLRTNAIHRIQRLTELPQRALWQYLNGPEGVAICRDTELWQAIAYPLCREFDQECVHEVIEIGPKHHLWPCIARMAIYPDQRLAQSVFWTMTPPDEDDWLRWRQEAVPDVPEEALLALHRLTESASDPSRLGQRINHAYNAVRSQHSLTSHLTELLLRSAIVPCNMAERIVTVLESVVDDPAQTRTASVEQLIRLVRYAQLECQLLARSAGSEGNDTDDSEPDIPRSRRSELVPIPKGISLSSAETLLQTATLERLRAILPSTTSEDLKTALQKTLAPAVLAGHYQRVHASGLPLLAEALNAACRGPEMWTNWRFWREKARAQLAFLEDDQVASWSRDLRIPVTVEKVPTEICQAAARLRDRFQRALQEGDIPARYRDLVKGYDVAPHQQITRYQALRASIGSRISGQGPRTPVPAELVRGLPEDFRVWVTNALTTADHQELLKIQHHLDRAIRLMRLLACDEKALAHNQIRANGEGSSDVKGEGVVSFLNRLKGDLDHEGTRAERVRGESASNFTRACQDALAEVGKIKNFITVNPFFASECGDFVTLIEIGNRPYGQGSCQNFASTANLNRALLAYVVDAMTKAIVIRSAPSPANPEGTPVARAIVRVGDPGDGGPPALLLEPTYVAGEDVATYQPMIQRAALTFARARGWRLATLAADPWDSPLEQGIVRIAASQNGVQYEDQHAAIVGPTPNALPSGSYEVKVSFLT